MSAPPARDRKLGTRLPDDFAVTTDMADWARESTPHVDGKRETERFVDYWHAKPGKDGRKLDWVAHLAQLDAHRRGPPGPACTRLTRPESGSHRRDIRRRGTAHRSPEGGHMTPEETLVLTRYVKACCPQQAIDKYTPEAWHDLLGDLSLEDCRAAVVTVAKRQPFVAPAEIRAEVRAIRDQRLDAGEKFLDPPSGLDGPAYQQWLINARRRIADGTDRPRALEVS